MTDLSDFSVWGWIILFSILFGSLLVGNIIRRKVAFLKESLIPTSVIGGAVLLLFEGIFKWITGTVMFDTSVFGGNGTATLEVITYHALALGLIASTLKSTDAKLTKQRTGEIFNTGLTTVSTYLIQGILGLAVTIIAATILSNFYPAAGVLLPFGYGQGTGQALNYGNIYEKDGFLGGKSFGLTIAAMGFISAALGGVIHLLIMKKAGKLKRSTRSDGILHEDQLEADNEIPMQESVDKMTIQLALILVSYAFAYILMLVLGNLLPGMTEVIYGFNFLFGVLTATLVKLVLKLLQKTKLMTRKYTNNFLMTRVSNFFFDIMIVAGVAAIRIEELESYWGILLILGVGGVIITYAYNRFIAKVLFTDYVEEQFLMMYGMLTGTASTGMILLREIDPDFKTPAADNLVFQNFPAIVFGFPMMFLATFAMDNPAMTLVIFAALFIALNILLFRRFLFPKFFAKREVGSATADKS